MSNIHVFYHVYQAQNWELIYQQQIHALYLSGLIKHIKQLHIGVVGSEKLFGYPENTIITYHSENKEEADTLKMIKNFCEHNDGRIMYFHTKGISKPNRNATYWRLLMEYYNIHKWQECVKELDSNDCVGINFDFYTFIGPHPHYSGNFWWANSDYIKKLDHSYLDINFEPKDQSRCFREFWIGSNYQINKPKMKELFNSGYNNIRGARHYHEIYPESNYIK